MNVKLTAPKVLTFAEAAAVVGLPGRELNTIRDKNSSQYDASFPPRFLNRFDEAAVIAWKKTRDDRVNSQLPIAPIITPRDRRANMVNRRKT